MKKVVTLSQDIFREKCFSLVSKIDYQPQLIVGVLNGGGFVLDEFKLSPVFKDCIFDTLKVSESHNIKKVKKFVDFFLKLTPYFLLNILRNIEQYFVNRAIEKSDELIDLSSSKSYQGVSTILIVDDALDSGRTMDLVIRSIKNVNENAEIRTAVISWTNIESLVKPNYFIFENKLVRFFWSKDFK